MTQSLTYPGVYIQEISSSDHTIIGVTTAITAFIGWAPKGSISKAEAISSWSEYSRLYGGLDSRSYLGYAVNQYFENGGQQAYIVRLVDPTTATSASVTIAGMTVTASAPGSWLNGYRINIQTIANDAQRFNLHVYGAGINAPLLSSYANLSLQATDAQYVSTVIANSADIIQVTVNNASNAPVAGDYLLANGSDGSVLNPGSAQFHAALAGDGVNTGLYLLTKVDLFNLLVVPGESDPVTVNTLQAFAKQNTAFLITSSASTDTYANLSQNASPDSRLTGDNACNAAYYFPWINAPDPLQQNNLRAFPPCGFVAGIYAQIDSNNGVWKAPAGVNASIRGSSSLLETLNDQEQGVLNNKAINCLRNFPSYGMVIWGARTLQGSSSQSSEWEYIPVRRTALFIEASVKRGLQWVVFEINAEPLWAQIRLSISTFLETLFQQGAFQGQTPQQAYFVKCDQTTTSQTDINQGLVNIVIGFAPLKPAEFIVINLQQIALKPAP
ncbi:phage tail sheath subtilisin-like domain-containing protein [Methylomonas sp. AM2-LC]|uniref:phage tail sheath family protein n=1 Tax=Methylomonas sp. AM2-LC TaxID=3153301 RepID=UPI003263B6C4